MARCIVINKVTLSVFLTALLCASPALAGSDSDMGVEAKVSKKKKKVPYRGSVFQWGHSISALTFDRSAESTYNPYYSQGFSFQPRWYLRDDLSLRARFDMEVELTQADTLDSAHELFTYDLYLEGNYAPKWAKIPFVGITVNPSLRFYLPTGTLSKRKSLLTALAPGVVFRRSFKLLKGKWLKEIGLTYGFRVTKYFNSYETSSLDSQGICGGTTDVNQISCFTSGSRNVSYRLVNTFGFNLKIMEKLSLGTTLFVINDMLYEIPAGSYTTDSGSTVDLPASEINHRGSLWGILSVSYEVLPWMELSLGTSTFYGQLAQDSTYRGFFFNRYTNFTFDVSIPIDKFVAQVQDWTGLGKGGGLEDEEGREEK